jgi:hypothetical protein
MFLNNEENELTDFFSSSSKMKFRSWLLFSGLEMMVTLHILLDVKSTGNATNGENNICFKSQPQKENLQTTKLKTTKKKKNFRNFFKILLFFFF